MDSDSSTKFALPFFLAILFHLSLIAFLIFALNFETKVNTKKPVVAMQASILDESQELEPENETSLLESPKKLSYLEKKRLAQAKKQALRLAQEEKKKLFAAAVQKLLAAAVQEKMQRDNTQAVAGAELEKHKIAVDQKPAQMQDLKAEYPAKLQEQLREQLHTAIEGKIKHLWKRPPNTNGKTCIVQVLLDKNGQVKKAVVERSSGNILFDESAINATYQAEPFQMPDDKELLAEILKGFPVSFGDD